MTFFMETSLVYCIELLIKRSSIPEKYNLLNNHLHKAFPCDTKINRLLEMHKRCGVRNEKE